MKNVLKVLAAILVTTAVMVFFLKQAKIIQPDPDTIFKRSITGIWHNMPLSDKTWIEFNKDYRCNFHVDNKDNPCTYTVKNKEIFVILASTNAATSRLSVGPSATNDPKENAGLGLVLHQLHLEKGYLSGMMKAVGNGRETISRPIHLKKVNPADIARKE